MSCAHCLLMTTHGDNVDDHPGRFDGDEDSGGSEHHIADRGGYDDSYDNVVNPNVGGDFVKRYTNYEDR